MPSADEPPADESPGSSPFDALSLSRSSTVERVAEELRRALFDGELQAGTPLRETALTEQLDVSRSTVREALGLLVSEGLAVRAPHRGVTVTAPTPEDVRDVCRARSVLETAGVRCWPDAPEQQRRAVRDAVAAYATAGAGEVSWADLNAAHLGVHTALVGLTGSRRLTALADSLTAELRLILAQVDRTRRNTHAQVDAHRRLVDLLERGEVDEAAAELAHHLADAEQALLTALARG